MRGQRASLRLALAAAVIAAARAWGAAPTMSMETPGAGNRPPPGLQVPGRAGPSTPAPCYDDSRPLDAFLMGLFRSKVVAELGIEDTAAPGFAGLMELVRELNSVGGPAPGAGKTATQEAARRVLNSLFPSWLPGAFGYMFSRPFPGFSSRLNAWVTQWASQWLMGPSMVNDVEIDGGSFGPGHGLKVERCRFLEESG